MTADSQWAVQTAVVTALKADAALIALVNTTGSNAGIYDFVDADTPFPYVVVGEGNARAMDTKTEHGMDQTLMIHTWSEYRGMKQVKEIMAAVVDALDRAALSVTGHDLIDLRFEFSDILLDPDGLTRHGVQRFRVMTEAT